MRYILLIAVLAAAEPIFGSREWLHKIGQAKTGEYNYYSKQYRGIMEAHDKVVSEPQKPKKLRRKKKKK